MRSVHGHVCEAFFSLLAALSHDCSENLKQNREKFEKGQNQTHLKLCIREMWLLKTLALLERNNRPMTYLSR